MPALADPPPKVVPVLSENDVRAWVAAHVPAAEYQNKRVLLVIPDATPDQVRGKLRGDPAPLSEGARLRWGANAQAVLALS